MSDLIDRQAAIDALQKEINKGKPPFDDVMGSIRCGVRLARNIIEDLPPAQPERWIPCSERLPEKNKMDSTGEFREAYLVTTGHQMFTARFNENGWWVLWGYPQVLRNIVAWMPLPEPYKGEQE